MGRGIAKMMGSQWMKVPASLKLFISIASTFFLTVIGWVIFRIHSLGDLSAFFVEILAPTRHYISNVGDSNHLVYPLIFASAFLHVFTFYDLSQWPLWEGFKDFVRMYAWGEKTKTVFSLVCSIVLGLIFMFILSMRANSNSAPFIYFQF